MHRTATRPTLDRDSSGGAIAHVPALDGLRGVAIALVLVTHFGVGANFPGHLPGVLSRWIERVSYVGWVGVDLFFVLSGFLITSILLASRDDPAYFQRFYARRALRIFPLYVVALLVALVGIPVVLPAHAADVLGEAPRALVWLWTYTLNIANAFGWVVSVGVLGQMWSLAIEEQFYAVWPWVVRQLDARRLAWACAVLVVGALLLRLAWIDAEGLAAWPGPYRFTLTRVDALAAGAVLAVAWRAPAAAPWIAAAARVGLIASGGVLLAWFVWAPRFYPDQPGVVTVGHTVLAIASSCLVARGLLSPPRWMSWRLLRALGTYSYGVYVWHWFVQYPMVLFADGLHPAIFVACGVSASLLLGVVSYHVLERPFLRLKHAFDYVGSSRPVAVDAG